MSANRETVLRVGEGLHVTATTVSGFEVALDSAIEPDGPVTAASPMELLIVALGGCAAMDVISILRKMRTDVTDYEVRLSHTRAPEHPKTYVAVEMRHLVRGNAVAEANVRRAIALTMARYCPVYAMLSPTVAIRERFEITDEGSGDVIRGDVTEADATAASA